MEGVKNTSTGLRRAEIVGVKGGESRERKRQGEQGGGNEKGQSFSDSKQLDLASPEF